MADERPRIHISLTVDEDFYEAFNDAVDDLGCTKAELVKEALDYWFEANDYIIGDNDYPYIDERGKLIDPLYR